MSGGVQWFKNAVIYQIFIDRFAGFVEGKPLVNDEFYGGNIRGILDKFDYFKRLGVNTLWISPFYKCNAYHGYETMDLFKVDPRFGSKRDLKKLIKKVHKSGMKIIAGFVPNHLSWKHPYFLDAQRNPKSKYRDWFMFVNWPNEYVNFLGSFALPKLNLDHPGPRNYLIKAAKYWLKQGLDGFRLDYAVGPKHSFWREFRREVKKVNPEAVLIGEAWFAGGDTDDLGLGVKRGKDGRIISHSYDEIFHEYVGELDGVLDFEFQRQSNEHFIQGKFSREEFADHLIGHYSQFPKSFLLPSFLDNHDMDRFLFQCGGDKGKLRAAAHAQFSTPQPKIIYYGTEIGMTNTGERWRLGDWSVRLPMIWDESLWDLDLFSFYSKLTRSARGNVDKLRSLHEFVFTASDRLPKKGKKKKVVRKRVTNKKSVKKKKVSKKKAVKKRRR